MEVLLVAKVGMVMSWVSNGGYILAGGIFLKTAFRYFKDYKNYDGEDGI